MPNPCPLTRDEIFTTDPHALSEKLKVPVIWTDHQATRRQRLHGALFPNQDHPMSSTHLAELLEYVHDCGWNEGLLITEKPDGSQHCCWLTWQSIPEARVTKTVPSLS